MRNSQHAIERGDLVVRTVMMPSELDTCLIAMSEETKQMAGVIMYECVRIMFEHHREELRAHFASKKLHELA